MPLVPSPVDYAGIRAAFARAIQAAVGLEANAVIQLQSTVTAATRPQAPFAAFMLTSLGRPTGRDARLPPDETGRMAYVGQRMCTAQFQFMGRSVDEACGMAAAWASGVWHDHIEAILFSVGDISIFSVESPSNITDLMATGYEGRAVVNLSFGVASQTFVTVDTIQTVPLSGSAGASGLALTVER